MIKKYCRIHIALPVLDESGNLPEFLEMLRRQSFQDFTLHVCVNQPEEWWEKRDKVQICLDNRRSMELLSEWTHFPVQVIDRSSRGRGWIGKRHGVGWARKTVMDSIDSQASRDDLIVSLDADTLANRGYLSSVMENFNAHPEAMALAVPYYHRLTGDPEADRAILRYEIYMRNYTIHMLRIRSPYSFTALGSAMAFPLWAFSKTGGMTPMMSGEDFYFLQKMAKAGPVLLWNKEKVYPAARFSDRVYFGTGPAMIKGRKGDWDSYPIYHHALYNTIERTYHLFRELFIGDCHTPMDDFLKEIFKEDDIWIALRKNYKSEKNFIRACHVRLDGLRILQFLKKEQRKLGLSDEKCLANSLEMIDIDFFNEYMDDLARLDFASSPVPFLDRIRNRLAGIEEKMQKDSADNYKRG